MNAAEPAVGHEHDDIPIAMLAHDGRDDVLVIRKVARPLPLRTQIRYEPIAIQAISFRDYPLVQGCVLSIAVTYVAMNLLTDLAYGLLDPRIRYD